MRRKLFLHEARGPGGGDAGKSKMENPKIENCKIAKIENRNFWFLQKKQEKAKNLRDHASLFDGYRRSQKRTSAWSIFNTALDRIVLAFRYRSFRELKVSRST
jgi:hypothetical protein